MNRLEKGGRTYALAGNRNHKEAEVSQSDFCQRGRFGSRTNGGQNYYVTRILSKSILLNPAGLVVLFPETGKPEGRGNYEERADDVGKSCVKAV